MPAHEKIVVITKKTALEELIERHSSREQARFYVESRGASFGEYEAAHDAYQAARRDLARDMPSGARVQWIERDFLPTFTFGSNDLVVTLGPDGLVVNAAKYLNGQSVVAFNPDLTRVDGVLLPFPIYQAKWVLAKAQAGEGSVEHLTMAEARLNDGQNLLALNDFFIGRNNHASARYRVNLGIESEEQLSSGILVSTGAGSTGWMRSVLTGAGRILEDFAPSPEVSSASQVAQNDFRFGWSEARLRFSVREPFVSKTSGARLVFGEIENDEEIEIVSLMPQDGVIFSDGVIEDALEFNAGAIARVGVAARKLHLVTRV
jgi:NAD kinase